MKRIIPYQLTIYNNIDEIKNKLTPYIEEYINSQDIKTSICIRMNRRNKALISRLQLLQLLLPSNLKHSICLNQSLADIIICIDINFHFIGLSIINQKEQDAKNLKLHRKNGYIFQ